MAQITPSAVLLQSPRSSFDFYLFIYLLWLSVIITLHFFARVFKLWLFLHLSHTLQLQTILLVIAVNAGKVTEPPSAAICCDKYHHFPISRLMA